MCNDLARLVAGEQRRRLGEAIADRIGETRIVQEGLDVGGDGCAADAEEAELAAEGPLELEAGDPLEGRAQDRDLVKRDLLEGGLDARAVDFLDDQRDREHQRRPDCYEGGKEGRSRRRPVEVVDCGAVHDGDEKADRELVGVGEGQDGKEAVRPPEQGERRRRPGVVDEVAMSEHDAFGLAHRAGRIEDGSQFVRLDRRRREGDEGPIHGKGQAGGTRREHPRDRGVPRAGGHGEDAEVFERNENPLFPFAGDLGCEALGDDENLALGVLQDRGYLLAQEVGHDGDGDRPRADDAEIGKPPFGPVLGEQGHSIAFPYTEEAQQDGYPPRFGLEIPVDAGPFRQPWKGRCGRRNALNSFLLSRGSYTARFYTRTDS